MADNRDIDRTRATPAAGGAADAGAVESVKRLSGTNAGIGVWLIIAPFVLGYSTIQTPLWNDIACGVLIAALGIIRFGSPLDSVWASYTNAGIGAWLIVAPFVLRDYVVAARWNDIVVGVLVLVIALMSAAASRRAYPRV